MNDGRHVVRSLIALVALLTGVLLGSAAPASAHATLTGSDPRDGGVLKTAPKQVTATFDESVTLVEDSLRVVDPDGRPVTAGRPHHAGGKGNTDQVNLTDGLGQGTYTVSWRVVSADSHAVSGAFTFSVGKPSATRATIAATPAVDPIQRAVRHRPLRRLRRSGAADRRHRVRPGLLAVRHGHAAGAPAVRDRLVGPAGIHRRPGDAARPLRQR
ncbi:copper resistance CopC family protein [Streptomyces shenzhenensis]|uniref:copper resistance CopC family protein n=1 Tax=Streptomyces shenzhenensis TaxID=943815 RepID=UPI0027E454AB|nr:copper resistance protein CopC [Streptomyces shenzhenensis]